MNTILSPKKSAEIEELARLHHQASERLKALGMSNTATDPKEREEAAVQYALAQAEEMIASERLSNAMRF